MKNQRHPRIQALIESPLWREPTVPTEAKRPMLARKLVARTQFLLPEPTRARVASFFPHETTLANPHPKVAHYRRLPESGRRLVEWTDLPPDSATLPVAATELAISWYLAEAEKGYSWRPAKRSRSRTEDLEAFITQSKSYRQSYEDLSEEDRHRLEAMGFGIRTKQWDLMEAVGDAQVTAAAVASQLKTEVRRPGRPDSEAELRLVSRLYQIWLEFEGRPPELPEPMPYAFRKYVEAVCEEIGAGKGTSWADRIVRHYKDSRNSPEPDVKSVQ